MINKWGLCFGKNAPKHDPRTLQLSKYLRLNQLPSLPDSIKWTGDVTDWRMFLNDSLGDCTIAAKGHAVQVFTLNQGVERTVSDDTILHYYELWDGYVNGDPSTDNGGAMLDVLNHYRREGFAGSLLKAFAAIDHTDIQMVEHAIHLFGVVDIGFQVPASAMQQFQDGQPWDVVSDDGGIEGGHDVILVGYNSFGPLCITWGKVQPMSWPFFLKYVDEAYALFSPEWLNKSGIAPNAIALDALEEDLQIVTRN